MTIREFRESDIPRAEEILDSQGFKYEAPDWRKMIGGVLLDDSGVVRILLLNRPTVESYALVDSSDWATPGVKAAGFEKLDRNVSADLRAKGYTDQTAWIPPQCRAFIRRLQRFFGWQKIEGEAREWSALVRYL